MSKVVIIVSGGLVQSVMTDSDSVDVLVLDCDCDGVANVQEFLDDEDIKEGIAHRFKAVSSIQKDVLPDRVTSLFQQACV
jgi:hypothetical protein